MKFLKKKMEKSTINLFEKYLYRLKMDGGVGDVYHLNRLDILIKRLSEWYSELVTEDVFKKSIDEIKIRRYSDFSKFIFTQNIISDSVNNSLFGIIVESELKIVGQKISDILNTDSCPIDKINEITDSLFTVFQNCIEHTLRIKLTETKNDIKRIDVCSIHLNDLLLYDDKLNKKLFSSIHKLNNQGNLIVLNIADCDLNENISLFVDRFNKENELYLQINQTSSRNTLIDEIDNDFIIINDTQLQIMTSYWVNQSDKLKTSVLKRGLELIKSDPNILKTGLLPKHAII